MTDAAAVIPGGASGRNVDLETLKALAHPLRVQILHALTAFGPQTASSLAARLGESSGSTSYHLRQLEAKHLVREVEERGTARERWWERIAGELNVWTQELASLSEGRAASATVLSAWNAESASLLDRFIAHGDDEFDEQVLDAARVMSTSAQLTVDELRSLTRDVERLIRSRTTSQTPTPGSMPVLVQFNAFPIET